MSRPCITATWTASRADSDRSRVKETSRALDVRALDRVDDVNDRQQRIESRVDVLRAPNRRISMEDLLKDFGVGAQGLARGDGFFHRAPGRFLVRMGGADQVHRDVRIDQDHGFDGSLRYPRSISSSI